MVLILAGINTLSLKASLFFYHLVCVDVHINDLRHQQCSDLYIPYLATRQYRYSLIIRRSVELCLDHSMYNKTWRPLCDHVGRLHFTSQSRQQLWSVEHWHGWKDPGILLSRSIFLESQTTSKFTTNFITETDAHILFNRCLTSYRSRSLHWYSACASRWCSVWLDDCARIFLTQHLHARSLPEQINTTTSSMRTS